MLVAVTERHLLPVLAKYPELQGVLIDLPEVVSNTLVLETSKFGDRCRAIGGDVLELRSGQWRHLHYQASHDGFFG